MHLKRLARIAALAAGFAALSGDFSLAQWQPVIGLGSCPYAYQPVCARSRKRVMVTYANACAARADQARVVADGSCPADCPPGYAPVCARGANGARKTYMNSCAAEKDKAHIVRSGRCMFPSRPS
jgi:hypothetical protein